jgi:hypothetical protein
VYDAIESEQLPAHLVCITPEFQGEELGALATDKGLDPAVMAHDPANSENISLNNILQVQLLRADGTLQRVSSSNLLANVRSELAAGSHRISKAGIDDPAVLQLWWALERGRPGVLPALVKAAKRREQAAALLATVQTRYDARASELLAADASLATFEAIEAWLEEHQGLDTRDLAKRYKELGRDRALKDELRARSAYQTCIELLSSDKPQDRANAKAGLAQLAEAMPDTAYGAKAATAGK